jgi:hypothetical protein
MQESTVTRLRRSTPRRLAAVALGWVASIPLLMSFGLYATIALQTDIQSPAHAALAAGVSIFALHLIVIGVQSVVFVRGMGSRKPTWFACLGIALLFAAMATANAVIAMPRLELLGPFSLPHVVFAVALFIWNKPASNPSIELTA